MPIPSPSKSESRNEFISRCMGDSVMNSEYKDQKQRAAICYSKWEEKSKKAASIVTTSNDEFIITNEKNSGE